MNVLPMTIGVQVTLEVTFDAQGPRQVEQVILLIEVPGYAKPRLLVFKLGFFAQCLGGNRRNPNIT